MWKRYSLAVLLGGAMLAATTASADTVHVRGKLEAVNDRALIVATDHGPTNVTLADEAALFKVSPARLADVAAGQFIGVTSIEVGGERIALEVHIFDESLRGLAEGHYPWDLVDEPNMMTNAAVAQVVERASDREVKVTYEGGEQILVLPEDVVVVFFEPAGADSLVTGEAVFLLGQQQDDGGFLSPALVVGSEGAAPPM